MCPAAGANNRLWPHSLQEESTTAGCAEQPRGINTFCSRNIPSRLRCCTRSSPPLGKSGMELSPTGRPPSSSRGKPPARPPAAADAADGSPGCCCCCGCGPAAPGGCAPCAPVGRDMHEERRAELGHLWPVERSKDRCCAPSDGKGLAEAATCKCVGCCPKSAVVDAVHNRSTPHSAFKAQIYAWHANPLSCTCVLQACLCC